MKKSTGDFTVCKIVPQFESFHPSSTQFETCSLKTDKYHYYYEVKWEKGVWSPNLVSNNHALVSLISET